jgi:hypothetical protein
MNYKSLWECEIQRVNEIVKGKSILDIDEKDLIFSSTIYKKITNNQLAISGGYEQIKLSIPFYSETLHHFCIGCSDKIDTKELKILLESGMIIPILGDYESYKKNFIDIVINYPHISFYAFQVLKRKRILETMIKKEDNFCSHCYNDFEKKFSKYMKKNIRETKEQKIKNVYQILWMDLNTPMKYERDILDHIMKTNSKKELGSFLSVAHKLAFFRDSQALKATPIISMDDNINFPNFPNINTDYHMIKSEILKGLDLVYSDEIPFSKYLEIIEKDRKKIILITNKIISQANIEKYDILKIRQVCADINEDIRALSKTKHYKISLISSNFVNQNKATICSALFGAGLSICVGINPVIGATATGIGHKAISIKNKVNMPIEENKYINNFIGSIYSPIVEKIFYNNMPIVQAYSIKKDLEKIT